MTELVVKLDDELEGWRQAVQDTSPHPELHAIAKSHLERVESRLKISPEHHQSHIDLVRPAVPNIDSLPSEEQDYIGEIIEIGQEALEDTAAVAPSEKYTDPEVLDARINEALTSCEVEATPEVREAIKEFYGDHYSFADLMNRAIDGSLTLEECDAILDKNVGKIITAEDVKDYAKPSEAYLTKSRYLTVELPSINHAATLLAAVAKEHLENASDDSRKSLLIHSSLLLPQLFKESALPVTTLNEKDYDVIGSLFDKLAATATDEFPDAKLDGDVLSWSNGTIYASSEQKHELLADAQELKDSFWEDTRHAGQLIYHNTGQLDDVSRNGGLMSRLEQKRRFGGYNHQTQGAGSGAKHHSVVPHLSEQYSPKEYKIPSQTKEHGTPIWSGTVAIPLANVIEAAPYARDAEYATVRVKDKAVLDKVPLTDTTGHIGVGAKDEPGKSGGDRVFFASPTERGDTPPDSYVIKLGGPRRPESRNTLIFFGSEEIASSPEYGLGEQFPNRLHILTESEAAEAIRQLQAKYIDLDKGRIVVPLRRGVFDFIPEGMEWASGYRAPQAVSYKSEA